MKAVYCALALLLVAAPLTVTADVVDVDAVEVTLWDVVSSAYEYTLFSVALGFVGLASEMDTPLNSSVTVLAPTNQAFMEMMRDLPGCMTGASLPEILAEIDSDALASWLAYHFIDGYYSPLDVYLAPNRTINVTTALPGNNVAIVSSEAVNNEISLYAEGSRGYVELLPFAGDLTSDKAYVYTLAGLLTPPGYEAFPNGFLAEPGANDAHLADFEQAWGTGEKK